MNRFNIHILALALALAPSAHPGDFCQAQQDGTIVGWAFSANSPKYESAQAYQAGWRRIDRKQLPQAPRDRLKYDHAAEQVVEIDQADIDARKRTRAWQRLPSLLEQRIGLAELKDEVRGMFLGGKLTRDEADALTVKLDERLAQVNARISATIAEGRGQ